MKRVLLIFIALVVIFVGVWITKSKTPAMRPDSYANGITETSAWYNKIRDTESTADAAWVLDPEIPENYIPVPGADELYMVVDENGNIIKYRHRTQQPDGSWIWEDVNPDIPENYEPVPGLEDVYKVTYEDGTVKYFKYIRNADDTFAFVEVDEFGNPIGYDDPEGSEIPDNYEHITDNIYAIKDDNGVTVAYKRRTLDDFGDYIWEYVDAPLSLSTNIGTPELNGNVDININVNMPDGYGTNTVYTTIPGETETVYVPIPVSVDDVPAVSTEEHSDGTYTETETRNEIVYENGFRVTYTTTVIKTFDQYGNIISSKSEGPYESSRVADPTANASSLDPAKTAETLSGELARMSVGVSFDSDIPARLLAKLNTERAASGLGPLASSTGDAMTIAKTRASAMATNANPNAAGTLYGSIADMAGKYGTVSPRSENIWYGAEGTDADTIHSGITENEKMKEAMLDPDCSGVAIAVAVKNGIMYICEVFV